MDAKKRMHWIFPRFFGISWFYERQQQGRAEGGGQTMNGGLAAIRAKRGHRWGDVGGGLIGVYSV